MTGGAGAGQPAARSGVAVANTLRRQNFTSYLLEASRYPATVGMLVFSRFAGTDLRSTTPLTDQRPFLLQQA
jgi:hypothetical protein